jgi:hypothetical protein
MKRIIKALVVTALMVVLMATTVSPAYADRWWDPDKKRNYGEERSTEEKVPGCNWWKC